jgi:hypothetical protein
VQFPPVAKGSKPVIVRIPVSALMTSEFGVVCWLTTLCTVAFPVGT